jgi:hypothetical protein
MMPSLFVSPEVSEYENEGTGSAFTVTVLVAVDTQASELVTVTL